jgi:hypothetical protein
MNKRRILASALIGGIALVFLSACTLIEAINPPWSELRLLRVQMPQITEEDLPYEIAVTFEAEGRPTIKQACLRWLTERSSFSSPPLHCYATETQGNQPIDSACSRWTTEGPYSQSSPLFCSSVEGLEYGSPGRFFVKIQTRNVGKYYDKLECYAEYSTGGGPKQTNRIRTQIMVERPE